MDVSGGLNGPRVGESSFLPQPQDPGDSSQLKSLHDPSPTSFNSQPASSGPTQKRAQSSILLPTTSRHDGSNPNIESRFMAQEIIESPPENSETSMPRKSVQFKRDPEEMEETEEDTSREPSISGDKADPQSKTQSLLSKLRALTTSQINTHTRAPSSGSATERTGGKKDLDSVFSARSDRTEGMFPMTLEEGPDSEINSDADAEDSAAEAIPRLAAPVKHRRFRRYNGTVTAPVTPHSPGQQRFLTPQITTDPEQVRPRVLSRSATDTELANRSGTSEDEGRRRMAGGESPWRWKHSRRNVSYGGQLSNNEQSPENKRPTTLRNLANIASHLGNTRAEDSETPKTPRRRGLGERGTTFGAQKWRQMQQKLRMLGQGKKKDRTVDHEKSAELIAELAAGSPAALIFASMFQRDEHGARRIPVILEQLKVSITDSYVERGGQETSTQSDRHLIFRIELEYGNGINRMKWVVKRSLYDFITMHVRYKFFYRTGKFKSRSADGKKMPKFPKNAFPYSRSFRNMDDEEDEDDDQGQETEDNVTDTDPTTPRPQRRPSYGMNRSKSSNPGTPGLNNIAVPIVGAGLTTAAVVPRRDGFDEKRRKKLEIYLQRMIKFMLFRPESNRLCKFLEISALGMRLAAEGSYHGKEGYLVIQSAKGLDFRKALTPANIRGRHTPKWFLVRHSYVVCVDSPEEMHIYDVFLFDSDFKIRHTKQQLRLRDQNARDLAQTAKESAKHPQHHRLKLQNSERKLKLIARTERHLLQFEDSIANVMKNSPWVKRNRFESFAPVRPKCFAQWLVDGRDHMWVVSRAINQARDVIYIHDWWLSPELYMRRPPAISGKWRLDRLLKKKAEEGVKVFVIVYRNIESAIPIDSQYTKFSLLDLHPNIFVQRSPNQFRQNTFFWAHHEKLCIVDHSLAFVGGIDLCFGRWDTPQHTLVDDKPTGFELDDMPKDSDHCQLWPGKDYSNPRVQDFYALYKPYEEMYDRNYVPRMPWHDISMQVVGQPARDLTRHFVQRWNYILRQRKPTRPTPFLLPPPDFNPADLEALGLDGTCEVQILRSAGPWSLGTPDKTEQSIQNAYIKMIEESEHFVYIENQFFISSCSTDQTTIQNHIGDALVERICRAHKNSEAWRAIIVIPLIPGFQNTVDQEGGTSVRLIMQYQYRSICRGESSIFGRLKAEGIDPSDYIEFYSLRKWGKIGPKKALVTEQLYIHAKCMVVDDRIAVIGSANINERSMLGNRDSECAAVVRDTDMIWSRMNGEPYRVGRFAHTLRIRLMREHLGLDVDKIMEDAQIMTTEHRKSNAMPIPESAVVESEESPRLTRAASPGFSDVSQVETLDHIPLYKAKDTREELLLRNDTLRSFNHDVDWNQAENPNLKTNRRLTEDSRVTGNEAHRRDVQGHGHDNCSQLAERGWAVGRDTTLVSGNKEVLTSDLDAEGLASTKSPVKPGRPLRLPSYVVKMEAPNPPLPPRPAVDRMSTVDMGLPMLSQLPALPGSDDTDIGGPPVVPTLSKSSAEKPKHPLMNELKRPAVDRDCMQDPLHEAFLFSTWHEVAENNTKIYRAVFRCMPDNLVRDWRDYHEYVAYAERFDLMQGLGKAQGSGSAEGGQKARSVSPGIPKSGPPGVGVKNPGTEIKSVIDKGQHFSSEAKEKVGGIINVTLGDSKEKQEKLGEWAVEMNRRQFERQARTQSFTSTDDAQLDEKSGLETVPEGLDNEVDEESPPGTGDSPSTIAVDTATVPSTTANTDPPRGSNDDVASASLEKVTTPPAAQFVGYSDALNMNLDAGRRRRRGTSKSLRVVGGQFKASDDIMSSEEAEDLLGCLQGHLVLWPYDWLDKVEAGGNWLYPLDQISPIEIYV